MPTARVDTLEDLESDEESGVLRSLKRKARVVGLQNAVDYQVLYNALDEAGVPQPGEYLDISKGVMLALARRETKLLPGDKSVCDVILHYNHILDGPYQNLVTGHPQYNGAVFGRFRSSVSETTTNISGAIDSNTGLLVRNAPLIVEHVYPNSDTIMPKHQVQGGEFKTTKAQATYTLEGYMDLGSLLANDPKFPNNPSGGNAAGHANAIRSELLNALNADNPDRSGFYSTFLGRGKSGTWLCTEVQCWCLAVRSPAFPNDPLKRRYAFTFEWQYDEDGWEEDAVFKDHRSNRPPPNLVPGLGFKPTVTHRRVYFQQYFGDLEAGIV